MLISKSLKDTVMIIIQEQELYSQTFPESSFEKFLPWTFLAEPTRLKGMAFLVAFRRLHRAGEDGTVPTPVHVSQGPRLCVNALLLQNKRYNYCSSHQHQSISQFSTLIPKNYNLHFIPKFFLMKMLHYFPHINYVNIHNICFSYGRVLAWAYMSPKQINISLT